MDVAVEKPMRARRDAVARAAQRRLVAHIAAGGTTDMSETPLVNEGAVYCDPQRFERERDAIFFKTPLVAGLSRDIAEPGDVMLFEELGRSIIIARGRDGIVRAFLNMCTHRGTRLINAAKGGGPLRRTLLTCPFHAWCFDLEGKLVARPGDDGFAGVGARDLIAVPVGERCGLIFVALSADAAPVEQHLAMFADELAFLEMESLWPLRSASLQAVCNWKLAIDTYAESYHFGVLHASTIGRTHFGNVAVFDAFGAHWRLHFAEKALAALIDTPETDWPPAVFAAAHFIFPNTVLVAATENDDLMVRLFRIFPEAPDQTTCRIGVYGVLSAKAGMAPPDFIDEARNVVTDEDYGAAIGAQANLAAAPPGFRVVYGRNEPGVQTFHKAVAAAIGAPGPARAD
jgi:phenylpropionate dioxygenase-like ring-hydroxylating dioxygenase large terminal subunit